MDSLEKSVEQLKERERALSMSVNNFQLEHEAVQEKIVAAREEEALARKAADAEEKRLATITAQADAEVARFEATKVAYANFLPQIEVAKARLAESESLLVAAKNEYTALAKEHEAKLLEQQTSMNADIAKLEARFAALKADVARLEEVRVSAQHETQAAQDAVYVATKQLDTVTDTLEQLRAAEAQQHTTLASLRDEEAQIRAAITDSKSEATEMGDQVLVLQTEIKTLTEEKAKIEQEYETEKIKLFNISRREEHVRSQEAYVRDMYKKAGITYTEFSL